jgi:hypothetical protein
MDSPPPDATASLDAAWAEVEASWDDAAAHKKFLALADLLDRLPDAGRRYRAVRENDPARAERAKQQVDALFAIAMTRMTVEKSPPPKARRRLDFIAFGIASALIAASLWSMLHGR